MKNAIILHGQPSKEEYYNTKMPSMSNAHWIPWLQGQLLKNDIKAATPEVPFAFKPDWDLWEEEVERFEITPDTIIVGHSRGGDFWLKYLSDNKDIQVGRVVLVAPSLGYLTELDNYFGKFDIDPDLVGRTKGVTIFNSDNDQDTIHKSVQIIRDKVKDIGYKEFHNYGHFCLEDMKTEEFPELAEEILR